MIIESSAPTRVDLEGGTIDIWPLYLFHPGAMTVNFAVRPLTHCRIETRADERIIIKSEDQGRSVETTLERIDELADDSELELLSKLVHFFHPTVGFDMTTRSDAPAGAGLAGSSALNIACVGALNALTGNRYPPEKFIMLACNVETTVIRVPAGFQDYYAAFYGGASRIEFKTDGITRSAVPVDVAEFERRFVILYTGEPRNSGTNNWEMFKTQIDEIKQNVAAKKVHHLFDGIRDAACAVNTALEANDWTALADAMRAAYPLRKQLAPNITTPQMDKLVAVALANGAEAAKVCGAGGGGCIAFLCADGRRNDVESALTAALAAEHNTEGRILDWSCAPEGLQIKVS